AVRPVFRGNRLGEIVERLDRNLVADQAAPERREIVLGIDRAAFDADVADDDLELLGAGGRRFARQEDGRSARLRLRRWRVYESLPLSPGKIARRNNLRAGGKRYRRRDKRRNEERVATQNNAPDPIQEVDSILP